MHLTSIYLGSGFGVHVLGSAALTQVIMLDGSNHLGETFDEQRNTVKNFTHSLYKDPLSS